MPGGIILKLAQTAAEDFIRHGTLAPLPAALPPELLRQKACFITIYENPGRHYRASYGTPIPHQVSLAQEIMSNTAMAIQQNPGHALRSVDLSYLKYEVAVVESLERITSASHLQPDLYGLYLRSDRDKIAVILPRRTGIESADDQLATAFRESGINTRAEAVTMYRFPVTFYGN